MVVKYYMAELEDYSWIVRGKQRKAVIKAITYRKPQTPTELAHKSKLSLNHTSRVLSELKKKELAKCLNPKNKTGRLYILTKKGKVVKDKLIED